MRLALCLLRTHLRLGRGGDGVHSYPQLLSSSAQHVPGAASQPDVVLAGLLLLVGRVGARRGGVMRGAARGGFRLATGGWR